MGLLPKSTNSNNYSKAGQDVGRSEIQGFQAFYLLMIQGIRVRLQASHQMYLGFHGG